MKGSFSEEALRAYSELAAEKQGLDFAEGDSYDFTRCVRPDGSVYGTGGRCRKGTETGAKESSAPVAPGQKTSNKKSAVKSETAIKELEQRIARQKAFLSRMSPGKYTAREREIEKKTLQEMVSRLAGMKSTTRSGKDGAAALRAEVEAGAKKRGEQDRQKNILDARARVKEIQDEIKNRGPHSKEEKAYLAKQLKQAQNNLERFETGKMMTREQFQAGLKRM